MDGVGSEVLVLLATGLVGLVVAYIFALRPRATEIQVYCLKVLEYGFTHGRHYYHCMCV